MAGKERAAEECLCAPDWLPKDEDTRRAVPVALPMASFCTRQPCSRLYRYSRAARGLAEDARHNAREGDGKEVKSCTDVPAPKLEEHESRHNFI